MLISRQISLIAFHHRGFEYSFSFDDTLDKNSKKRGICLSDGTRFIETNGVRFVGALLVFLPCLSSSSSPPFPLFLSSLSIFFLFFSPFPFDFRLVRCYFRQKRVSFTGVHATVTRDESHGKCSKLVRLSNENTFSSY